jgi:hypothetical protein
MCMCVCVGFGTMCSLRGPNSGSDGTPPTSDVYINNDKITAHSNTTTSTNNQKSTETGNDNNNNICCVSNSCINYPPSNHFYWIIYCDDMIYLAPPQTGRPSKTRDAFSREIRQLKTRLKKAEGVRQDTSSADFLGAVLLDLIDRTCVPTQTNPKTNKQELTAEGGIYLHILSVNCGISSEKLPLAIGTVLCYFFQKIISAKILDKLLCSPGTYDACMNKSNHMMELRLIEHLREDVDTLSLMLHSFSLTTVRKLPTLGGLTFLNIACFFCLFI